MEVLGVYPESNVSSVSDILLREIAGSIGIITAGLTKDEVENRIISELIPDFPEKKDRPFNWRSTESSSRCSYRNI
jgi:hypothetical protein